MPAVQNFKAKNKIIFSKYTTRM